MDTIELKAVAIRYGSCLDEAAFFQWLQKLSCVSHFEGRGDTLYIQIVFSKVDESALRELLALFARYNLDMIPLIVFDTKEFAQWFRDEQAYWYRSVFA